MTLLKKINLRTVSQITALVVILWLAFLHQMKWIEVAAPVDAYCPFGAIETALKWILDHSFLTRLYWSNIILATIFVLMTLFLWRVFCSYMCPLWALQEWMRLLWNKLWIKKTYELPKSIDKILRYLKYLILAALFYLSYSYSDLVFRYYDPFVAFSHLWNEFDEIMYAYIILWTILVLSLFTKNWWCRYLCPLGAFYWIIKKFSFFKIEKNFDTCTKCWACNRSCPVWLDFNNMKEVNGAECIGCLKCVSSCNFGSLKAKIAWKEIKKDLHRKITYFGFFWLLLILIFTPIWQTKPTSNLIWSDGKINVEDLRWSNTLEYTIKATWVPFEYFQKELWLPSNVDKSSKLKHIWEDYNIKNKETWEFIETEEFREAIEKYMNENKK